MLFNDGLILAFNSIILVKDVTITNEIHFCKAT